MTASLDNRRPIASRSSRWANRSAAALARWGVSANIVSLASLVFALLAAACLVLAPLVWSGLFLVAAVLIPLRLVANLLDGMVAVEQGRATPLGPLYNEVPDRASDIAIIAALGHAAALSGAPDFVVPLGWFAAVAAVLTAYVRELGRALGAPADFAGPLAKQQRMWVAVVAALVAGVLPGEAGDVLLSAVALLAVGALYTAARRIGRLARHLAGDA